MIAGSLVAFSLFLLQASRDSHPWIDACELRATTACLETACRVRDHVVSDATHGLFIHNETCRKGAALIVPTEQRSDGAFDEIVRRTDLDRRFEVEGRRVLVEVVGYLKEPSQEFPLWRFVLVEPPVLLEETLEPEASTERHP